MIDINCHILSKIKDSPENLRKSLDMAKRASEQGISHIIATPELTIQDIKENIYLQVEKLNRQIKQEGMELTILPGAAATINYNFLRQVKENKFLPLQKDSQYLLVNLPNDEIPHNLTEIIFELHILGYQIIIANPELNHIFMKDPIELFNLVKAGVLTQISAASIIGKNGWKIQRLTEQLIKWQLTHFVATSAQSEKGLLLDKAYTYIQKYYGTEQLYFYSENAQAVIDNKSVYINQPIKPNKVSLMSVF